MELIEEKLLHHLREGRSVVMATIIASRGSTPRKVGAKMIVQESGAIDATLGGGAFEALVIEDAKEAMRLNESSVKFYRFMPVGENATGMTCGGEVEVFLEVHRRHPRLLLFGGGHVALPVARMAYDLNYRVCVIDDRPTFACRERFPLAHEIFVAAQGFAALDLPLESDDYAVVVTRCHQTDEACLRLLLNDDRECAYVGVVASRRKAKVLLARLAREGFDRQRLERVRAPIGLDLGAETPEEIALSILGEILAVRTGKAAGFLSAETSLPDHVSVRREPRPPRRATTGGPS